MMRNCGGCTLCCKLLPVRELDKKAGKRCRHQRTGKGCAVYNKPGMPPSCSLWNCRWLVNDDTGGLSRPDRSHYVIDIMPDYITVRDNDSGEETKLEVIQIWCDPNFPDAHRDPALRAYLERRAAENKVALVRYSSKDAFTLMPPTMTAEGRWIEAKSETDGSEHSLAGIARALSEAS